MRIFGNLDLQLNELLQHRLEQLTSDPSSNLVSGRIWYNSTDNTIKYYDGNEVRTLATGVDTASLEQTVSQLQAELDATQTGAGLNVDGTYVANNSANYISGATSLKNADDILDAQVKANADGLAQEIADRIDGDEALQAELDRTQTGAGLNTDGSYSPNTSANYISGATSLKDADIIAVDSNNTKVTFTANLTPTIKIVA